MKVERSAPAMPGEVELGLRDAGLIYRYKRNETVRECPWKER
jgi:hypothetical protein